MARGKTKKLPVDQGEIRKLMAQMQRCLMGGKILAPSLSDRQYDAHVRAYHNKTKTVLLEQIKEEHQKVWEHYHGDNHQTIEQINAFMDDIGEKLRELRAEQPPQAAEKREYYTKHAMTKHAQIEDMVSHLKRERTKYVNSTLHISNRDGKERTPEFVNKTFPQFNMPKFMQEDSGYDIRKMMTWLRNTKRKAFKIYYDHIQFNTIEASKMDGEPQIHGRTQRSNDMEAYVEHFDKAHKAIIQLRRMRHPRNPKKAKKSRKERRNHENKKKQHVNPPHKMPIHGDSRLTAFPDLDDYGF